MLQSITLEKAAAIILDHALPTGTEKVCVTESFERILAEDIEAEFPLPPFRRTPLDGFALRAADTAGASTDEPIILRVVQTVYAGEVPPNPLEAGEACAVTTGAPLPEGSDTVIKFEDVAQEGNTIAVNRPLRAEDNVVSEGEDVALGEKVLEVGAHITPAVVGLLASLGSEKVRVFKKPRVAIVSIGDELIGLGQPLKFGKIYNSNQYTLSAQVREAGGIPFLLGTIPDDTGAIAATLKQASDEYDLIITTGGASVGRKDLVKEAIRVSGARILFWKVGIQPGTPVVCGEKNGKLIVGLSGNPSAATITFLLLARPAIRTMAGYKTVNLPEVCALMDQPFNKTSKHRRFLRATVTWENGAYHAVPAGIQSPGALKSMVLCNALVSMPPGHGPLQRAEEVAAILLPASYCLRG